MKQEDRILKIQEALDQARVDGWLFYSFHGSDPFASRILLFNEKGHSTRRWYYFLPSKGEPVKIVHMVEKGKLDELPGRKLVYLAWKQLHSHLKSAIAGSKKICMQYSPYNAIPYVSCVDGGTIELIRSFGIEVVSSANLIQRFESVLSTEQLESHRYAVETLRKIIDTIFQEIARRMRERVMTTEYDLQQLILKLFQDSSLITESSPIVAVNDNAANPHYEPVASSSRIVKEQDLILVDIWAKKNSPQSTYGDITWMGYLGSDIPSKYADVFEIVKRARDEALSFIKKALAEHRELHGWEVDDIARGIITDAGYGDNFIHRTGHSIGEECHGTGVNIDNLETQDNRLLIPGSCFSIEPGIYIEGDFGIRSEINVYIQGNEVLTFGEPLQDKIVAIMT